MTDLCTGFLLSSCEVKAKALICTQSAAVFLFLQAQSEFMSGQGEKRTPSSKICDDQQLKGL